jgi:hypothetical protein
MAKSRKKKSTHRGSSPRSAPVPIEVRRMVAADEAERRGDARAALEVMERSWARVGVGFWRPWRIQRLWSIACLEPMGLLPSWAVGRWVLEQALQDLSGHQRQARKRALEMAMDVGRLPGAEALDGYDLAARVSDRDWLHRQLYLYEFGGLDRFVRRVAAPDLIAGVPEIGDWITAPMGGYRFLESSPDCSTVVDLGSGLPLEVLGIGSLALVLPGEHVIGRLVPDRGRLLFETVPLLVPQRLAESVARDPASWVHHLRKESAEGERPITSSRFGFLSDLPHAVTLLALMSCDDSIGPAELHGDEQSTLVLRRLMAVAREALAGVPQEEEAICRWAVIYSAITDPTFLCDVFDARAELDFDVLSELSRRLAEPAASICRSVVAELGAAA